MKPTIPSVRERFQRYHERFPSWGSLHIVLDDGNVADNHVQWSIDHAVDYQDEEGAALGRILLTMSKTQRRKLGRER